MTTPAASGERETLYDADSRETLYFGAPLIAALLLAEGIAHLDDGFHTFNAVTILGALLIAPTGWLARQDHAPAWPPIRYWPLWPWAVCMVVLAFHLEPYSHDATTYLIVGLTFGCAALIIAPAAFAISTGSLGLVLLWWLRDEDLARETNAFALLCLPLAGALYWARRRSLLLGEQQRLLERELARQRDEMELVRRVLGMNRGLTHHFNNVFSGIVGGASLALEHLEEGHPAREAIAVALASGEHGSEIIERLGLSGDRVREPVTEVAPRELLRAPEIEGLIPHSCRFDIVTAPDLPPLRGQRKRLTLALKELVANSVEAIGPEQGAIRIEIGIGERPDRIDVVVIDSGVGMSEGELQRCFEPFYTTREPRRRGLGLPYVMGVVERHEGTIRIDSQPGRGTRVRLSLPTGEAEGLR
jgi:signal transduction histidine kinase